MFLNASAAKGLDNINASDLMHTNIRPYLEEKFGLSAKSSSHFVQTIELNEEITRIFNLSSEGDFYEIHAKVFSNNQHPMYFQRIYVATDACALMF